MKGFDIHLSAPSTCNVSFNLVAKKKGKQHFHWENSAAKKRWHCQRDNPLSRILMEGGQVLFGGMICAHPVQGVSGCSKSRE